MNPYFFRDQISIHRTILVRDEYGQHREVDPEPFWSGKASVQPYRSTEALVERDTTQEWLTVYIMTTVEFDSTMRVAHSGHFYQIEGEPERWEFGHVKHVKLTAWKVVG